MIIIKKFCDVSKKISDIVNRITLYIAALLTLAMFLFTVYGSFMRYILRSPKPWPMPISRILMIWVSMLGITVAFKYNEHVAVESLRERLPYSIRKPLYIIILLLIGTFAVVLVWKGWEVSLTSSQLYMITRNLRLPYRVSMIAVPISGFIHLIHIVSMLANLGEEFIDTSEIPSEILPAEDLREERS